MELSRKNVKPPFWCTVFILQVYFTHLCFETFWVLEHLFIEKNFLGNDLIFPKWIFWQSVRHSWVHFSISFTLHSWVHFSINFIKNRNCNGYVQRSYSEINRKIVHKQVVYHHSVYSIHPVYNMDSLYSVYCVLYELCVLCVLCDLCVLWVLCVSSLTIVNSI